MAKVKILLTDTTMHGATVYHAGDTMEVDEGADLTIMLSRGHKRFDEVKPTATPAKKADEKTSGAKPTTAKKADEKTKNNKDNGEDLA